VPFERTGTEDVFTGKIARVRVDSFRHEDGEEVTREIVAHPGAVAIFAHDGERFFLVAQPREAVNEQRLLELPAGKLDEEGEDALATAKRELAEEIGKGAHDWRYLTSCYSSPGFADEEIHLFEATGLYDAEAASEEIERIEIESIPFAQLDETIAVCRDAKSLVAMLWVRAFGTLGTAPGA